MSEEILTVSAKEFSRLEVIEQIKSKRLTQLEGAKRLGLSKRQVIRPCKAYREHGPVGLISKRRGKPSNNQLRSEIKEQAIQLIREHYPDFGPTFAHEKLAEKHGLRLCVENLRQLMIKEGGLPV